MSSRDKTARLRVILHADDLGISYEVNDAIFDLMQHNMITSASILANGPAFEDAARRSRLFPNCSFGIHLNLTQFGPLSSRQGLQSFLNQNGQFTKRRSVFATGVAARS